MSSFKRDNDDDSGLPRPRRSRPYPTDGSVPAAKREKSEVGQGGALRLTATPTGAKSDAGVQSVFSSLRARALYRFITTLAENLDHDIERIFDFARYNARHSDALNAQRSDEPDGAESPGDIAMVRVVEQCVRDIGYSVVRALAMLREYGGAATQRMCLYSLIRTSGTMEPLVSLVKLLYSDQSMYAGAKSTAVGVQRHQVAEQFAVLEFFQSAAARVYAPDAELQAYQQFFVARRAPLRESFADAVAEEAAARGAEWPPLIAFARLLMQSCMLPIAERDKFDSPSTKESVARESGALGDRDVTTITVCPSRIAMAMEYTVAQPRAPLETDDALMVILLQPNGPLYSTMKKMLNLIAIDVGRVTDQPQLRSELASASLIMRTRWIELVSMQYYLDRVYWGRSDERKMTLRRIMDARAVDLAYCVANA